MSENTQRTESILKLMDSVERGSLVLPEFQRDFVWEIQKTLELFDSLTREIFIGAIIFGVPSFSINVRDIDSRPRRGTGSRTPLTVKLIDEAKVNVLRQTGDVRLILDGQQRITALYRALRGIDKVFFSVKELTECNDFKQSSLEDLLLEFSVAESSERMSISLDFMFSVLRGECSREAQKIEVLKSSSYAKSIGRELSSQEQDLFLSVIEKFGDLLKREKLVSFYLLDTSLDKFASFFERSNTRGMQLNFIDILAAKLYSGFNLRQKCDEFIKDRPNLLFDREIIVRTISFIVSEGKEIGKDYILKSLLPRHFNEYWDEVCELYVKSISYLVSNKFALSQSFIPYYNMVVPLMLFLKNCPSTEFSQINERQAKLLGVWFWRSVLGQRYSSHTTELVLLDAKSLIKSFSEDVPLEFLKKNYVGVEGWEELLSIDKPRTAVYKGIMSLLFNRNGLYDWNNGAIVSSVEKTDDHHIFPHGFLDGEFKGDQELVVYQDSIINRTMIPKISNIKIGKKAPSSYLKEISLNNTRLEATLEKHFVPKGLISGQFDEDFRGFMKTRGELILKVMKEACE